MYFTIKISVPYATYVHTVGDVKVRQIASKLFGTTNCLSLYVAKILSVCLIRVFR